MRKPSDNMAAIDDRILEHIHDNGFGGSATVSKSPHIGVSQQYISQRISVLRDLDLIYQVSRGIYQLTGEGRLYLAGAYDVARADYLATINPDHWPCADWTEVGELADEIVKYDIDEYDINNR
jgi:hypothetical protein